MTAGDATLPSAGWRVWWMAARPRTLPAAVGPVVVGTAVAAREGGAAALPALAALVGALLLQIVSNLANDLFDFEKGADTDERVGPPRVTQLGLLTPTQMRVGTGVAVAASVAVGLYLVSVGGWPVLVAGSLAIAAALAYTGGPRPFGYVGLGDPAVFLFFGVVAVTGTAYVQQLVFSPAALAASLPVGALATAILVVNNLRDIPTDAAAGKRTLAVRMGASGARAEYAALLAFAYLAPIAYALLGWASPAVLLCLGTLPMARSCWRVVRDEDGPALNDALAGTAKLSLATSLLLALGWWL